MFVKTIVKQVRKLSSIFLATLIVLSVAGIASAANVSIDYPGLNESLSSEQTSVITTTAENSPAGKFYTAALEASFVNVMSLKDLASSMTTIAQQAVVGASASSALTAAGAGYEAIMDRNTWAGRDAEGNLIVQNTETSFAAGSNAMKNGLGVWLMPLYKWTNVQGQDAGNGFESGYNSSLGGIALGADYTVYDALRFGLSFNLGAGYTHSNGDLSNTHSNFDFWGLGLYSAYRANNFTIMLDLGYTESYNKISTAMPLGFSDLKADTTTSVWAVGLTAEYLLRTSAIDIIPHAGVRYMNAYTYNYTSELGGDAFSDTAADSQDVWYFPVGITFQKTFTTDNNWMITPKVDLGFIAKAGDLKANSETTNIGSTYTQSYEMPNLDSFAFNGGVGLDFSNDVVTLGVNYNLLASEHETSHMIFATLRLDF